MNTANGKDRNKTRDIFAKEETAHKYLPKNKEKVGKMKKITKLMAALLVMTGFSAATAAETLKLAPGAALLVYNVKDSKETRPAADADPVAAVVDKEKMFWKHNVGNNQETRKFGSQSVWVVWKGYIAIPAKGMYTFSIAFDNFNDQSRMVLFQLNGQDFMAIPVRRDKNKLQQSDSRSVMLEKGNYEVTFVCFGSDPFSVRMWNKSNPLKKTVITPEMMTHAE